MLHIGGALRLPPTSSTPPPTPPPLLTSHLPSFRVWGCEGLISPWVIFNGFAWLITVDFYFLSLFSTWVNPLLGKIGFSPLVINNKATELNASDLCLGALYVVGSLLTCIVSCHSHTTSPQLIITVLIISHLLRQISWMLSTFWTLIRNHNNLDYSMNSTH